MKFLIFLVLLLKLVDCYKIFVYSSRFSRSHHSFMSQIADTLAVAGHDVLLYSAEVYESATFKPTKKARSFNKEITLKQENNFLMEEFINGTWNDVATSPIFIIKASRLMGNHLSKLCQSLLADKAEIEKLRNEKFDIGITQSVDFCGFAFFEILGLEKYVVSDSLVLNGITAGLFGIESSPSYVPFQTSPYSDKMTYWQRANNMFMSMAGKFCARYFYHIPFQNAVSSQLSVDFDFQKKLAKSTFILVNADEYVDFPRPITHKIVYIGGIGAAKPKQLEGKYKTLMDNAKNGAVFVSFGSIMKSIWMPTKMKQAFVDTFKKFPKVKFIWKYETDDDVGSDLPNLMKVKWAPQNDLLGHPNLKAFITHAGLNSITETTRSGVPLIAVPLFSDQSRNAKMVEKHGMARIIIKQNITKDALVEALQAVLYDKSYKLAAKRIQQLILSKPVNASERLIKHVEFAVKFGPIENLDCASINLNFMQYYLLDIIIPFVVIVFSCFCLIIYLCLRIAKKLFSYKKVKGD